MPDNWARSDTVVLTIGREGQRLSGRIIGFALRNGSDKNSLHDVDLYFTQQLNPLVWLHREH